MIGAEVQANAIATILDDVPLRDVPMGVDLLAILVLAAVAPLAALRTRRWLAMVKHSLRTNGPRFSAARMVEEYAARIYPPA